MNLLIRWFGRFILPFNRYSFKKKKKNIIILGLDNDADNV